MATKIKIIATPLGIGPRHIREKWVGCCLEVVSETKFSYCVEASLALHVLTQSSPNAGQWFHDLWKEAGVKTKKFTFGKQFCQIVNP